jgi:hypothetical protein
MRTMSAFVGGGDVVCGGKLEESSLLCSATTATFSKRAFSPHQAAVTAKPNENYFVNQDLTSTIHPSKMPSRGNPNVPNKQRRIANRAKIQKRNAVNKIAKNPRGTAKSNVLHPTSGPLAPLSGKKARKLEKAKNHARQRALEAMMEKEGEVQMTGTLGFCGGDCC